MSTKGRHWFPSLWTTDSEAVVLTILPPHLPNTTVLPVIGVLPVNIHCISHLATTTVLPVIGVLSFNIHCIPYLPNTTVLPVIKVNIHCILCRIVATCVSWEHCNLILVEHQLALRELAKLKPPRTLLNRLPSSALCSTALMVWILRYVFSFLWSSINLNYVRVYLYLEPVWKYIPFTEYWLN